MNLDWMTDALCAQVGGDWHFPDKGGSPRAAKRICGECVVRTTCLEYALINAEPFGVWGGLSEDERSREDRPDFAATLDHPVAEKYCRHCETWLGRAHFNKSSRNLDGLASWCRPCDAERRQRKQVAA